MPEIGEVERARGIFRNIIGHKLISLTIPSDDTLVFDIAFIKDHGKLLNQPVTGTGRWGKHFWVIFGGNHYLLLHLGMTGRVERKGRPELLYQSSSKRRRKEEADEEAEDQTELQEWPPRFMKIGFLFNSLDDDDGAEIAFSDSRRFARVRLILNVASEEDMKSLAFGDSLGPDVHDSMPTPSQLESVCTGKHANRTIKGILLDQSVLAGLGNWMVDEVLYQSGIHPLQPGKDFHGPLLKALWDAIVAVVTLTMSVGADASKFPETWIFHRRWGKGQKRKTDPNVEFISVGGRTCAIDPCRQKLRKKQKLMD